MIESCTNKKCYNKNSCQLQNCFLKRLDIAVSFKTLKYPTTLMRVHSSPLGHLDIQFGNREPNVLLYFLQYYF